MTKTEIFDKAFRKTGAVLAAGAFALALAALPAAAPAYAANGVQGGTTTYDSKTSAWSDSGDVDLKYSTLGGKWTDGKAADTSTDSAKHDNGTYLVTIPTAIAYEGMSVGTVSTSDDYTVNVRGVIPSGENVKVAAETGKALSNGSQAAGDTSAIAETTTQGKTVWTGDETAKLDSSGYVVGTDTTDNIKMAGTVKTSGTWTGTVGYSSELTDAA